MSQKLHTRNGVRKEGRFPGVHEIANDLRQLKDFEVGKPGWQVLHQTDVY
jgi:hypothetical protein